MARSGLSYDQGPPFAAPLNFFLSAPFFLLLAAGLGIAHPDWLSSRWSPINLALTHLLTLGFLAAVMVGALLQMLPVVLGSPVRSVQRVAQIALVGLSSGTACLTLGFLINEPLWLYAAMLCLSIGLIPFLLAVAHSLIRTTAMPHVAWPIRLAGIALLIVLSLGILLAGGYSGLWSINAVLELTALHAAWGLIGWILILVIGLAYQVVPMLQLTPTYPTLITRWLTWIMLAGLLLFSVITLFGIAHNEYLDGLILALSSIIFAVATLWIQYKRRRQIPDVTLDFWRLGMANLIAAALLYSLLPALPSPMQPAAELSVGILFLLGFATSVVNGMLYKIVPFLAWFHLKTQTQAKIGSIPNMKEMLPEHLARQHLYLQRAFLILLIPAPFFATPLNQAVASVGLLLLAASAIRLWLTLASVKRTFRKHGGRLN